MYICVTLIIEENMNVRGSGVGTEIDEQGNVRDRNDLNIVLLNEILKNNSIIKWLYWRVLRKHKE